MAGWPASLRARLTLWYSVLLGLPLIAFAIVCYLSVAQTLQSRTDRFIGDALTAFARELVAERRAALNARDAIESTLAELRFRELHVAIVDQHGVLIARSEGEPGSAGSSAFPWDDVVASLRSPDPAGALAFTLTGAQGGLRVLARPLDLYGQHYRLIGTYSRAELTGVLERLRKLFVIAVPLLIGFAAAGGFALARHSLAPVATMASRAAEISATNLSERLPVGGGAELIRLARVVNDLLDRLEAAFAQQRRFVADASHELRTPTAILRTEADVTLAQEHRAEGDYRHSLVVMRDAARRLTRIVEDLFLLARADAGHLLARRAPLYLEDLVHDAARAMHAVAERRTVRIELLRLVEAPLEGDPDLLGRLLLNLLDNAVKYSPPGGTVLVAMDRKNGMCQVSITDTGPGIPVEARERVFERFFRVEESRTSVIAGDSDSDSVSGTGLGLAIARRIAEMHAGRLDLVESRPGRTEFRVTLPVGAPSGAAAQ